MNSYKIKNLIRRSYTEEDMPVVVNKKGWDLETDKNLMKLIRDYGPCTWSNISS